MCEIGDLGFDPGSTETMGTVASGLPAVGPVVLLVAMTASVPSQGTTMGAPAMGTCPRVLHRIALQSIRRKAWEAMKKYELCISLD